MRAQTSLVTTQANSDSLSAYQQLPTQDLEPARFIVGDIVAEKCVKRSKAIPMKVREVIRPTKDLRGRYWSSYSYRFQPVFAEDGDCYVFSTDIPLPEGLLLSFEEVQEEVVGALASKALEIRDLNLKNPLRKN